MKNSGNNKVLFMAQAAMIAAFFGAGPISTHLMESPLSVYALKVLAPGLFIADKFCLDTTQAHIGNFSEYMCERLIEESEKVLRYNHVPLCLAG